MICHSAKPHSITVQITGNGAGGTGVLLAEGGRLGGFVLYAKAGQLVFENNAYNLQHDRLVSMIALPQGPARVGYTFVPVPAKAGFTFLPQPTSGKRHARDNAILPLDFVCTAAAGQGGQLL